jgi:hypothetical protein
MDLENQVRIKELAGKYGNEELIVVLGGAEAEASGLAAETVSAGDPTYAGALSEVPLGLKAYHIFELKDEIDSAVYDEQISMMEMVLDVEAICAEVTTYRG